MIRVFLFEDDAANDLVSKRRCSDFQNISPNVLKLDHSLWHLLGHTSDNFCHTFVLIPLILCQYS